MRIDFNCDLGEGCGDDAAIVPLVSSASIACGGHAGDAASMRETLALCAAHGVAVGAHPSFVDRAGFGRTELAVAPDVLVGQLRAQIETLAAQAAARGQRLAHVKPHGALYTLAARDAETADCVIAAVRAVDPALRVYALAGSVLARRAADAGLSVDGEAFAERRYEADGSLTPRRLPGASLDTLDEALAQVRQLLREGAVTARTGERVTVRAGTLCLHGDRPDAAAFARALRTALEAEGVRVAAPGT
ncbi:5-oxoprolinase subunit PxpA [Coralloluteibacterium thermophilus]|uniref:5-oxoprolinase subunit PxpA n=1 Tax=Coralloluteibacterium thermophilum TaxID=2707049 RepID=A0ABV9NME8_9GAMM